MGCFGRERHAKNAQGGDSISLKKEDKALLIGAGLAALLGVGSVLGGDARYAEIGGLILSVSAVLKATIKEN